MKSKCTVLACLVAVLLSSPGARADEESEIRGLCGEIMEGVGQWAFAATTSVEANRRHPQDPVQRALWIQSALPYHLRGRAIPFRLVPSRSVSLNGRHAPNTTARLVAHTAGSDAPSLRVLPDYELNSFRYTSVNDSRVRRERYVSSGTPDLELRHLEFHPHATSRMLASWLGGLTGIGSNSGRVMNQLRVMSGVKRTGLTFELLRPYWFESAVSAIDVPFHGGGTTDERYLQLAASLEFRRRYYESLNAHGLPHLAGCRSGENLFLAQLALEHPKLFGGMIWVNGMHPTRGYKTSLQGFLDTGVRGGAPYNPLALKWFLDARDEIVALPPEKRWWEKDRPFEIPLLLLVGQNDPQVSKETRDAFRAMARRNPDLIFYVEVPGAGHDVFSVTESFRGEPQKWTEAAERRAAGAWSYVYWFANRYVLKDTKKQEPALGWLLK